MEKAVKLFWLWMALVVSLYANSAHQEQIKQFDKQFPRVNSEGLLKLHHMLKNIYIQSIIENNTELKIDALERLIKSSNSLRLDASPYEKELSTLKTLEISDPPAPKPSPAPKPTPEPKSPTSPSPPKNESPPQPSAKEASAPLAALSVRFSEGDVVMRFNQSFSSKEINSFLLKANRVYRYVFDVPGALMGSSRTYESSHIEQVRVAQYNKKTIRIVFSHNAPLKLNYSVKGQELFIGLSDAKEAKSAAALAYEKTPTPSARRFDPATKVVVLDAGHGGRDGGAVSGKYVEKHAVLATALKIGKELKKRGYKVFYTRDKDVALKLRDRTRIANEKNADLFISVHANAAPTKSKYKSMHGVETFFLSPARSERSKNVAALENQSDIEEMNHFSKQTYLNFLNREKIISSNKFAIDVQQGMLDSLKNHYKVRDGGVREAPFWVLVGAQMPAILLEIGYITNPAEVKRIFSASYQSRIAKGVADGVDGYFRKSH